MWPLRRWAPPPGASAITPAPRHARALVVVCRAAHKEPNSLFIFGLGYTGLGAANYFQQRGWEVAGTCRSEEKQDVLRARGFQAFAYDADGYQQLNRQALAALQRSTHVLTTVPPDGDSDPVLSAHARHLADSQGRLRWVGYISSTSVYGDHRGGWVDEGSELLAAHGRGLSRMMTETAWLQLHYEHGAPVHVLRCGGIYGPRRSALEAAQRGGAPSEAQARRGRHRYTARCHVLDICRVVEASMERPRPAAVYNLVDDDPAGREEVVAFAADLLARRMAAATQEAPAAAPRGEAARRAGRGGGGGGGRGAALDSDGSGDEDAAGNAADPAPAVAAAAAAVEEEAPTVRAGGSRRDAEGEGGAGYPDEKRVRNELIKAELGVALEFPTYREGIAALVAGDMRPF